jgi:hypothetical protein
MLIILPLAVWKTNNNGFAVRYSLQAVNHVSAATDRSPAAPIS